MKLLSSLKQQPADNCFFLTYNVDLPFFEYMLFEYLYANGCRNVVVMCDPLHYERALNDAPILRYAGQRYLLAPARISARGAFHPKLILLTSSDWGRLYLASSNLTKAGYTGNWEVATLFEYNTKKPDPVALGACRWAFDTLSRIADQSGLEELARDRLEQLRGTTGWLRQDAPLETHAPVWTLHNLDEPLFNQVMSHFRQIDGSPILEAIVVSPFFDTKARAVAKLLTEFRPNRLKLFTQPTGSGLRHQALSEVMAKHQTEFNLGQLTPNHRQLHAKTLVLRSERGVWMVTGSANFSEPAWLQTARTGNTEMVVLRFEPDKAHFDQWLDELLNEASPMAVEDLVELEGRELLTAQSNSLPTLLAATLKERRLSLDLSESLPEEPSLSVFLGSAIERLYEVRFDHWEQEDDHTVSLEVSGEFVRQAKQPVALFLEINEASGNLRSNPVLLHNLDALLRFSQPIDRRRRPHVPNSLIPDSYEHCAQLLDMLHDLLATSREGLLRHRGRVTALSSRDRLERQMAVEEAGDYDPEQHFVDEEIRPLAHSTGAELYSDYFDRLTYEDLLRAALAAVYHPESEPTAGREPEEHDSHADAFALSVPSDSEEIRQQLVARIERGLKRLVNNFVQGIADAEYMSEIPPAYLTELFVIISAYLRVVWRSSIVDQELFIALSLRLLMTFWGQLLTSAWTVKRLCCLAACRYGKDQGFFRTPR